MFSVAGASLFLPFLPMLPIQILLNNLLYDLSQSAIPTDDVDREYLERPKRWDIQFIRLFMICLGPVSSLFDFLTFFVMLYFFNASEPLFQTAWFIESLTSQTLVIFVIRTKRSPFWKSKPSRYLLLNNVAIIAFALILPFTPLGDIFRFVKPPVTFYIALAIILGAYIVLAEIVKSWFYRRYGYRLEQTLIPPKKIGIYITKTTKLVQNVIATICLRPEDEITVDSLIQDLERIIEYPFEHNQIGLTILHLKRAGLISFDWRQRTIKREKALKEYVTKHLMASELWPKIVQDWHKISKIIEERYGKVNLEYQEFLLHKI